MAESDTAMGLANDVTGGFMPIPAVVEAGRRNHIGMSPAVGNYAGYIPFRIKTIGSKHLVELLADTTFNSGERQAEEPHSCGGSLLVCRKPGNTERVIHGQYGGLAGIKRQADASFERFCSLKDKRVISPNTRFQVSLPTPLAVIMSFVHRDHRHLVEPVYQQRLL